MSNTAELTYFKLSGPNHSIFKNKLRITQLTILQLTKPIATLVWKISSAFTYISLKSLSFNLHCIHMNMVLLSTLKTDLTENIVLTKLIQLLHDLCNTHITFTRKTFNWRHPFPYLNETSVLVFWISYRTKTPYWQRHCLWVLKPPTRSQG